MSKEKDQAKAEERMTWQSGDFEYKPPTESDAPESSEDSDEDEEDDDEGEDQDDSPESSA